MGRFRTIASSYWTALALGALAIFLHVRWYVVDKAAGGEVVSGFGAVLVVLGVFVGSRPYIRAGVAGLIEAGLPALGAGFLIGPDTYREHQELVEKVRPQVTRDVWAERVVAVAIVILGTLLNGYGPLLARVLNLRGS